MAQRQRKSSNAAQRIIFVCKKIRVRQTLLEFRNYFSRTCEKIGFAASNHFHSPEMIRRIG